MDNLLEYIIFFFVLWSLLSSVFGKKKQQQKPKPAQHRTGTTLQKEKQSYSSTDIFEELFGMKIPKTGGEYPPLPSKHSPQDYERNWETESETVSLEKTSEIKKEIKTVNFDTYSSLETAKSTKRIQPLTTAIKVQTEQLSTRTLDIKKKIKKPSTLREMILISEILNKPKALRK